MELEQWYIHMQKKKRKRKWISAIPVPYTKINSKWIIGQNGNRNLKNSRRQPTKKPLWFGLHQKQRSIKAQIDKMGFIKIKNVCSLKGPIKTMKRQAMDWEKICAKYIRDKTCIQNL